ncbi:MAG: HAD family hydrolase [Aestuariibacter sp.]
MLDKYELIVFDWDGTLMDSIGLIVETVQKTASAHGLPVPQENEVRDIIGLSLEIALKQLFPSITNQEIEDIRLTYKSHYFAQRDQVLPIFDHVESLLQHLTQSGKKIAVATGKGRPGLEKAMQDAGLSHYFSAYRTSDDAESKPSPDMLLQILTELDVAPDKAIMFGDSIHDLEMATRAGMHSIGVDFGAHDRETLQSKSPLRVISCYSELLQ